MRTAALLLALSIGSAPPESSAHRFRVASVEYRGFPEGVVEGARGELEVRAGAELGTAAVGRDSERLREALEDRGYLFAEVREKIEERIRGLAAVLFEAEPGPLVRIAGGEVSGAAALSESEILAASGLRAPGPLPLLERPPYSARALERGLEEVRKLYLARGYLRAAVAVGEVRPSEDLRRVYVRLRVREGARFRVARVAVSGNRLLPSALLLDVADLEAGGFYSGPDVEAAALRIARWYQEHTDRVPQVRVRHRYGAGPTVEVVFEIDEGKHRFTGLVRTSGNWKTRDRVIRSRLAVVPGDPLTLLGLEESRRRLEALGYFEDVELEVEGTEEEEVHDVTVKVKEKEYTGLIEVGGGASSGAGEVAYVRIQQSNFDLFRPPRSLTDWRGAFAGGGQTLDFELIPGTKESRFNFFFLEPYFFTSRRRLKLEAADWILAREVHDESRLRGRVEIERLLDREGRFSIAAAYTAERVEIRGLGSAAPPSVVSARGGTSLGYPTLAFRWQDMTVDPFSGPEGGFAEAALDAAHGAFGSERDFLRARAAADVYFTFFDRRPDLRHTLHLGLEGGWIEPIDGDPSPVHERFYLGGPRSFRGFFYRRLGPHENGIPVGGDALLAGTVEYSFPLLIREVRAVAFLDWGNLEREWSRFSMGRFRVAAGGGLEIRVPVFGQILPANFYWSAALTRQDDDRTQTFSFTLGYGF